MKKKVILTTYSHLLYTQNMSEPEERPYAGAQEEQNEGVIQGGAEATGSTAEEVQEEIKQLASMSSMPTKN